jgi:adenylate kinase
MIIFFGPTGSGKSMQGRLMAVRHGWYWLSAGQLLRNANNAEIHEYQRQGKMVPDEITNPVMFSEITRLQAADEKAKFVLDGFPRELKQAVALSEFGASHDNHEPVDIVIDIQITKAEIIKRLQLRGRSDDTPDSIEDRLELYDKVFGKIRDYYRDLGVPVAKVDGIGLVGEIHDRIEKILEDYKITGEF